MGNNIIQVCRTDFGLQIGDWAVNCEDIEELSVLDLAMLYGATLYDLIGLELHSVQQWQSVLTYKGNDVYANSMEDTNGDAVMPYTQVVIKYAEREKEEIFKIEDLEENKLLDWSIN